MSSQARKLADLLADDGTVKVAPTIFEQASVPATGFKLGDFWYDTDDDIMSVCIEVDTILQWKEI